MEVRDIFALRKEGKLEEAYEAISRIYAVHRGPHTNLCMFWCTNDILKLRLGMRKVEEARRLLYQLLKLYPQTEDRLMQGNRAIISAALKMDRIVENFNLIYFMPYFNRMTDADWQPYVYNGHPVPSLGQQVVNHLLRDLPNRDAEYINQIADLFRVAMRKSPYYVENLRHLAQMHTLLGQTDKAVDVYKKVLRRHHESYLYAELAKLLPDTNMKIALYCQAVVHQRREGFAAKYHRELALLMQDSNPRRAAYELQQCLRIRQNKGQHVSAYTLRLQEKLKGIEPVTADDEQTLYEHAEAVVKELIG